MSGVGRLHAWPLARIEPSRNTERNDSTSGVPGVPTLTRLLVVLMLLGAAGYGIVYSLANYVEPQEREYTVRVKKDGFGR